MCDSRSCKYSRDVTKDKRLILGDESIMNEKSHGSCTKSVQKSLLWGLNTKLADDICCFNRHFAEPSGYFETKSKTTYLLTIDKTKETTYYDSVYGKPVFIGPKSRTFNQFEHESHAHGWPSFRIDEVVWENVRVLLDGECVTIDGVHLGHNIPDDNGPRFCINLVCIAGKPTE